MKINIFFFPMKIMIKIVQFFPMISEHINDKL